MKKIIALALSMALCFSCIACDSKGKDNANNSNKKETTERDNENSKDKNVKYTKKDDAQNTEASQKENTVASSNNEENNNNVDKSSNNNTDTSSGNLDSKNASAADILRFDFGLIMAKSYVLTLSSNVLRSLNYKLKRGEIIGCAPMGYLNYVDSNGKHSVRPKYPDANYVKELFEIERTR